MTDFGAYGGAAANPLKRAADDYMGANKRQKGNTAGPSKVLHVRGLPSYTTETELVSLCYPYGQVVKCLILPEKHQAFVQMESVEAAAKLLSGFDMVPPSIRMKECYFQYSSRQEVETKNNGGGGGGAGGAGGGGGNEAANSILLVSVLNAAVPVTLDNIHQIFKPYGDVLKIITFNKQDTFQALVQMGTVESATNAKLFLEGKDMFQGCCHLRIGFSKRTNLVVRQNNAKSQDFTLGMPQVPQGQYGQPMGYGGPQPPMGGPRGPMGPMGGMGPMGQMGGQMGGQIGGMPSMGGAGGKSPVIIVNKLNAELNNVQTLFTLFGVYGDVLRVKILYNKRDTALIQFASAQQAANAQSNLDGCMLHGQAMAVRSSKHYDVKLPREDGKEDGQQLTQDFSGSDLHRFKRKNFINPKNVNPPSQVLHVANLHDAATEAEVQELFASAQDPSLPKPVVEFFKSNRKMGYVCMASVNDAVNALVSLHNYTLGGYPIRVSFSHKDPSKMMV